MSDFWERVERQQWSIFAIFIALLAAIVPFVSWKNGEASLSKTHQLSTGTLNPLDLPSNFEGVVVMANVTKVDPLSYFCSVRFLFIPIGMYARNTSSGADYQFANSVLFVSGNTRMTIDPLQPMPSALVKYEFLDGSPIRYPLDQYPVDFTVGIYDVSNSSSTSAIPIPVALGLIAAKQSWSANAYIMELETDNLQVSIMFFRSWMTKLFAAIVFLTMWVLAVCLVKITWDIWWEDRIAEPNTLRLAIRFLFAFPALRFTQPGLPVLGCTEDTASFFWCMGIAGICTVVLLSNYMASNIFKDNAKAKPIGKWAPLFEFYDDDDDNELPGKIDN